MENIKEMGKSEIFECKESADDFIRNILLVMSSEQKLRALDILTGMALSEITKKAC